MPTPTWLLDPGLGPGLVDVIGCPGSLRSVAPSVSHDDVRPGVGSVLVIVLDALLGPSLVEVALFGLPGVGSVLVLDALLGPGLVEVALLGLGLVEVGGCPGVLPPRTPILVRALLAPTPPALRVP